MGLRIIGCGSALPEKVLTNDDLALKVDTSDEWIRERTGIGQRHIASMGENVATLGAEAGRKALKMAGVEARDIDLILLATCSFGDNTPSAACRVQSILGAQNAAAFDIGAACTGFLTALTVADAYLRTGAFNKILVIGSETLSEIVDWEDRTSCILFGDGAGAVVVTDDKKSDMIFTLGADGNKADVLCCRKGDYVKMDGKEVYRFATTRVPECIEETLSKAGAIHEDINMYLLHQANSRIIESVAKKLSEDMAKFPMNLERVGNTSSASIPVLLDELVRGGKIKNGMNLVLSGFGAGLNYGTCLIKWNI